MFMFAMICHRSFDGSKAQSCCHFCSFGKSLCTYSCVTRKKKSWMGSDMTIRHFFCISVMQLLLCCLDGSSQLAIQYVSKAWHYNHAPSSTTSQLQLLHVMDSCHTQQSSSVASVCTWGSYHYGLMCQKQKFQASARFQVYVFLLCNLPKRWKLDRYVIRNNCLPQNIQRLLNRWTSQLDLGSRTG